MHQRRRHRWHAGDHHRSLRVHRRRGWVRVHVHAVQDCQGDDEEDTGLHDTVTTVGSESTKENPAGVMAVHDVHVRIHQHNRVARSPSDCGDVRRRKSVGRSPSIHDLAATSLLLPAAGLLESNRLHHAEVSAMAEGTARCIARDYPVQRAFRRGPTNKASAVCHCASLKSIAATAIRTITAEYHPKHRAKTRRRRLPTVLTGAGHTFVQWNGERKRAEGCCTLVLHGCISTTILLFEHALVLVWSVRLFDGVETKRNDGT
mmetsp:Transcript_23772/g.66400  ORF Transcript_23772/g.66400 Transcript_23772/m.66400 type:complete len:261 (+) Transcript_23772:1023-1805(+)